jgi:hypothetical protein
MAHLVACTQELPKAMVVSRAESHAEAMKRTKCLDGPRTLAIFGAWPCHIDAWSRL